MFFSLFFMIVISCSLSLSAMQVLVLSTDNEDVAWNIILTHGVSLFDGKMISTLARVSKNYDTILRQTAEYKKQYFIESDNCLKKIKNTIGLEGIEWHKYGAACGKVVIGKCPHWPLNPFGIRGHDPDIKEELIMERRCLGGISKCDAMWRSFEDHEFRYLPHQPKAFFNEVGDFCCYILHRDAYVEEFSLSANGDKKETFCTGKIKGKHGYESFPLSVLIEFPVLLKALLNSSIYRRWRGQIDRYKSFFFKGVMIPENYREYKLYFFDGTWGYQSFNDLCEHIRKPIIALYEAQHKNKKKKRKLKLLIKMIS
jgi:hypothetical protein